MAQLRTGIGKKLAENLQTDLRSLSAECKRKYPPVKEAAEAGLLKIRLLSERQYDLIEAFLEHSVEVVQPFILGCDTKNPRIVHLCLGAIQRLIQHQTISATAGKHVVDTLWLLMEGGIEELKLLQTAILIITTSSVVQHETLAKALVLAFRLHFAKDSTTINTAAATVRQLVSAIYERMQVDDVHNNIVSEQPVQLPAESAKSKKVAPSSLTPCATDAYYVFQDLTMMVNGEQPTWLVGLTEMTRTFGLELLEAILSDYPALFHQHSELTFLLKDRLCPMIIKLFSPNIKHRGGGSVHPVQSGGVSEKPTFPIVTRLMRLVAVLARNYCGLLITECEIFLSLLTKFLDPDKAQWQRALALEVFHKLCSYPVLIRNFCCWYDHKQHSTKVFQDMVNGLASYVQSQFVAPSSLSPSAPKSQQDAAGSPPSLVGNLPVGSGVSPQAAFCYRNIWVPLVAPVTVGHNALKPVYLDQLERVDNPVITDGYCLSIAFLCLLEIINSLNQIITTSLRSGPVITTSVQTETTTSNTSRTLTENSNVMTEDSTGAPDSDKATTDSDHDDDALCRQLLESSWCGILAAVTLLLDTSTDESATEAILRAMVDMVSLSGQLNLMTIRDAFITALCKAALPPHYSMTVTQGLQRIPSHGRSTMPSDSVGQGDLLPNSQVVAVATTTTATGQQTQVVLTVKNIACMRALLAMSHCHGAILGTAWHQVLTTLQHLVGILGLKPAAGGSMKPGQQAGDTNIITTAVMADLPVLAAMLSRLFENSQYLDDVALHHLVHALCHLCTEAMELSQVTKEPCLFSVAKLLETGLVNLHRLQTLWRPVVAQLLEVCENLQQPIFRSAGADAVTHLVSSALNYKHEPPLQNDHLLQAVILSPLSELNRASAHTDVRQRQLDCVSNILLSSGETLGAGWPLVLDVVGHLHTQQGEAPVRQAFQCLQLIVTDFLPTMPCTCLEKVVIVATKFGSQDVDVNVSLAAIGLLWNISDYVYRHKSRLAKELEAEHSMDTSIGGVSAFDSVWLSLFSNLNLLCIDPRPAVRKSAGQTLFSMITAHGAVLQPSAWSVIVWQVLFPLLDNVKKLSVSASDTKDTSDKQAENILIHHSRDTAKKQWSETRVLTLAGVARSFRALRATLQELSDFPKAWSSLLAAIKESSLSTDSEVALAALKSFQDVLDINRSAADDRWSQLIQMPSCAGVLLPPAEESMDRLPRAVETPRPIQAPPAPPVSGVKTAEPDHLSWVAAWQTWLDIGTAVTDPAVIGRVASQPLLTTLVNTFPPLFSHIRETFSAADLKLLGRLLHQALASPVHADSVPFILPVAMELTPLQAAILDALQLLQKNMVTSDPAAMLPELFDELLVFVSFTVETPQTAPPPVGNWVSLSQVAFAEAVVRLVVRMYRVAVAHPRVLQRQVAAHIVKSFHYPLRTKYGCPSPTTWPLLIDSLITVLTLTLPLAKQHKDSFKSMWLNLADVLQDFLFPQCAPPPTQSMEEYQRDEVIDCRIVRLLREDVLTHTSIIPHEFVVRIMGTLNQGSIHSATSSTFIDTDSSKKLREEFAKACFETLLQFSFTRDSEGPLKDGVTHLAVASLLKRCREVLLKYVDDERLSGKCPLPRPRMTEMSFVLKAISTLLVTLKKAPIETVEAHVWQQVIDLYPALVECTTVSSVSVCSSLKEALREYKDLLAIPQAHNGLG